MGILAGVFGSAVGAWLWSRQRAANPRPRATATPHRDHGTVIFHNTPTPAEGDIL